MSAVVDLDWTAANQALLVAEFGRLTALLGDGDAAAALAAVTARRAQMPSPAAIDTLTTLFGLSEFERDVLLLAAGTEMDSRLGALCGAARGEPQERWPSFGLALASLADPHWSALAPTEPLRRCRLVEFDEAVGLTAGRLRLQERVLHYLGGLNYLDHRLQALLRFMSPPGLMAAAHRRLVDEAVTRIGAADDELPRIVLAGDDPEAQQDVAAAIVHALGASPFRLDAHDVPVASHEQDAFVALWRREAALLGGALVIVTADQDSSDHVERLSGRLDGLVIVAGHAREAARGTTLRYVVNRPDAPGQRLLWRAAIGERPDVPRATLDALASDYRLSARRIERAVAAATTADGGLDATTLAAASRGEARALDGLAQIIDARAGWNNLVLPQAQRRILEQIVVHSRHRLTVHHDWGFAARSARGLGLATLFWGDSGTGKTLAAEVLAHALELALYRIDLSAVVSKYIGETEKNLRKVFDGAEDAGAILLFDEADALFGKRSEVKDSHDRYANIEVSYLLQRMEAYHGLAILTTNNRSALDTAFERRLQFVLHFPFPDTAQREAIWRVIFPADTPLAALDYPALARLAVPGGTIRNIALNGAFLAAADDSAVTMAHLLQASRLEATKRDKPFSTAETRGWI